MKILIVEDDVNSRVFLERALLSQGYTIESAANGIHALEKTALSPPDLIISDIMMPEMDGFELCRRVKTDERFHSIPFVFYTATYIDQKDEKLAMALGASLFLIKPMEPEEFFRAIRKVIEEQRAGHLPVTDWLPAEMSELDRMQVEVYARKLDKKVRELEKERDAMRRAEAEREKLLRDLGERVKELGCINDISRLAEERWISIEDFVQRAVVILPHAWRYPEICAARINLNSQEFKTANFRETEWIQAAEIIVDRKNFGEVAICYLAEKPLADEGPFLREERSLINTIADFMGHIIQHRLSEEEMKKLTTAVEHSADWILITDREGTIEYVNKAVEDISGYTKEELIGKNPRIFKSGRHDKDFFKELQEKIRSGKTFSEILINRKKSGELFELHYTITPLKDEEGNVHHFVATAKDITEKKLLEERLDYMAYYDSLTGLPNKRLFADRLAQLLTSAEQQGMHAAVLFVDIDRFTSLNETYGYEAGDEILKETGRRLSDSICGDCTVGRIDADKFGVILSDVQQTEDVVLAVEKMQSVFKNPMGVNHEEIVITMSAGVAMFPGDGKATEVLMQNAEVALAKAKAGGINMYQFFTAEMNKRVTEFIHLQRHLFNALDLNEFVMHYQPYFDSTTREMVGMEALIRWNSPKFGLVSPGVFIPILEETGMIIDVGKWIIRTVCGQIKDWMDKGYESSVVPVYVNLSLAQFAQRDLADFIERAIGETGIHPSLLGFEITESIFMHDVQHTQAVLENLREKGISVNIDDFGTGYSSLSNLKRLPVNNLKIDISFIRDVTTNPDDASIVITIISMAHNLNLKTIAEGVETEEQWKILRILKCDMVQGYYFSKPVPVQEVERFFKQQ